MILVYRHIRQNHRCETKSVPPLDKEGRDGLETDIECRYDPIDYLRFLLRLAMDTITDTPAIAIAAGMATVIPVCMRSAVIASASTVIFVTASDSSLSISSPFGSVPFAFALFTTVPASMSESDSLYVAVASIDSPGARTIPLFPDTSSLPPLSSPSDASLSSSLMLQSAAIRTAVLRALRASPHLPDSQSLTAIRPASLAERRGDPVSKYMGYMP